MFGEALDVRLLFEEGGVEVPVPGEGRIEELEAPVGPEEGNALVEIVEGLALHADELVVAALQLDLARGILVEIGDAAEGMLFADHMDGAAIRQVPPVFAGFERGIGGELLGAPVAIVGLFGNAALVAQAVEDLAVGGMSLEPGGIQRPELPHRPR